MRGITEQIQEAKMRLDIPALWAALHLDGAPPRNGTGVCRSPFRPDNSPSFSIYADGHRWKDQATDEGGDAIDFLALAEGLERRDAIARYLELAGMPREEQPRAQRQQQTAPTHPDVSGFRRPTDEEVTTIAQRRKLNPDAVQRAANFGILRAGMYREYPVWALVDGPRGEAPRIAEIRRFDGGRIPTRGNPNGVKGFTVWGSRKDWPVGASLLDIPRKWNAILLVEGMPDFLAAFHFCEVAGRDDLCPVSVLGRGNNRLHHVALEMMAGKRVRAFPHADEDGGGRRAMESWAGLIEGAEVDLFDFAGLRRRDGRPVNDLNDAAVIDPADAIQLNELLPA